MFIFIVADIEGVDEGDELVRVFMVIILVWIICGLISLTIHRWPKSKLDTT